MDDAEISEEVVFRFIADHIDTIPHMEALLLIWTSRPKSWTAEQVRERLYVDASVAKRILQDLTKRRLIQVDKGTERSYRYESITDESDRMIAAVANKYTRELLRVSAFIHAKAPSGVQEFARAFKFTKERE